MQLEVLNWDQLGLTISSMIYHGLHIFVFKTVDGQKQYAEVLVNDKTGSRHIRWSSQYLTLRNGYQTIQAIIIRTLLFL